MEKMFKNNLWYNTLKLSHICTDSLVRNLRLWRVQELANSICFGSMKAYSMK